MALTHEILRQWYLVLSRFSAALAVPVSDLADRVDLPLLAVFLFGLVGAVAPCQLTTNLTAMAYVGSRVGEGRPWREALTYILGKVFVYTLAGGVVVALGRELQGAAIPVAVAARKGLGPLMIVIGLGFLGLLRLRGSVGHRLVVSLQARLPGRGAWGAFLLGVTFAFSVCPTLFWLFFGLTLPLALHSAGGLALPGLFALGTALPLLAFMAVVAAGSQTGWVLERLRRSQWLVSRLSGVVFVLAGINDTVTYWAL